MSDSFVDRLRAAAEATDRALDRLLVAAAGPGEIARPQRLVEAMRYAALGPGKRLRPFLVIEAARLFGATGDGVVATAAGLECVHAYSLAHDDLPAMDDDHMRRGRPTLHKAFDEATAILAGDALLTLAFEVLADLDEPARTRTALIARLARAAGAGGMVGGQALDLAAEQAAPDLAGMLRMQAMKTGALFAYACEAGAILGGASSDDQALLAAFGERLGLAFQLADDLIDATVDPAVAGKATAKDARRGKATLIGYQGVDGARTRLASVIEEAAAILAPLGARAGILADAARFVAKRQA